MGTQNILQVTSVTVRGSLFSSCAQHTHLVPTHLRFVPRVIWSCLSFCVVIVVILSSIHSESKVTSGFQHLKGVRKHFFQGAQILQGLGGDNEVELLLFRSGQVSTYVLQSPRAMETGWVGQTSALKCGRTITASKEESRARCGGINDAWDTITYLTMPAKWLKDHDKKLTEKAEVGTKDVTVPRGRISFGKLSLKKKNRKNAQPPVHSVVFTR